MTLSEIAQRLNEPFEGNGDLEIKGVAGLKEAEVGNISFLANPKYASQVAETLASVVIIPTGWDGPLSCAVIRSENPDQSFAKVAEWFYVPVPAQKPGIHPTAVVSDSALLGEGVSIGAQVVIEDGVVIGSNTVVQANCVVGYKSTIGENCILYPLVSVREFTEIGNRVIIHNGAVIGSDGFGYAVEKDGSRTKIPQIGTVVIEDDVEIGANVAIDRARFGKTRVGKGTKVDNLVQIAHNVVIGEHSVLCGQVGVAGSSSIGSYCILAGQVGVSGHLEVGDRAIVGAQSGVTKNVAEKDFVMGMPAMNHLANKKMIANMLTLPRLKEKVKSLERELAELKQS